MKHCTHCGVLKPLDAYQKRNNGHQSWCKKCQYEAGGKSRTKRRARRIRWLNIFKVRSGCSRCGFNEHPNALDFHHLSDKTDTVANLLHRSISTIIAEVRKCVILCANCHRIEHASTDPIR